MLLAQGLTAWRPCSSPVRCVDAGARSFAHAIVRASFLPAQAPSLLPPAARPAIALGFILHHDRARLGAKCRLWACAQARQSQMARVRLVFCLPRVCVRA